MDPNSISEIDGLSIARESNWMIADRIDISNLSSVERVALMERLWRSLAGDLDRQGPPGRHDAELESREREWVERESVGEEWSVIREELRRELP
jgi:Putative addiction module component